MRLEQFLDRTAALDQAKAKAMAMRVEQARKMGLRARVLSEEQKAKRADAERKQYAALNASLQAFRSESSLDFSRSMDDSALNRTIEDQQSFCAKLGQSVCASH